MKNLFKHQGFSLIELLMVVAIFGVVSAATSAILFSLLRGSTKTEIVKEVKQNGDYALSVMEQKIRNATTIEAPNGSCTADAASLRITNPDSTELEYQCVNERLQETDIVTGAMNYLTNTSVVASACGFTCSAPNAAPRNVVIDFTLSQKTGTGVAETSTQTFHTQVSLRNE